VEKNLAQSIDHSLDKISDELSQIRVILARQEESLAYHIRRTDLLEKTMEPVRAHVQQMRGAGKLIALLALIATIAAVLIEVTK